MQFKKKRGHVGQVSINNTYKINFEMQIT